MNTEKKVHRIHLGVLDIFILAALFAVLVAGGLLLYNENASVFNEQKQLDTYSVTLTVRNIRASSKEYLYEGAEFYIKETGDYLGTVSAVLKNTHAVREYVTADGQILYVPNTAEDERVNRLDVTFAVDVKGYYENGFFYLNGNRKLAPNEEFEIRSKDIFIDIRVDSITQ